MSTPPAFTAEEEQLLLRIADATVRRALATGRRADPEVAGGNGRLHAPGACFVTLTEGGRLQGCIGSLEPRRPLWQDVARNALAAAFEDPRLPALTAAQFARIDVEISVLGPLEPVAVRCREELLALVRPGVDGLLVEAGRARATFLPTVWEQLADPDRFLTQLWAKAGLPARAWPEGTTVHRYRTVVLHDPAPRPPVMDL